MTKSMSCRELGSSSSDLGGSLYKTASGRHSPGPNRLSTSFSPAGDEKTRRLLARNLLERSNSMSRLLPRQDSSRSFQSETPNRCSDDDCDLNDASLLLQKSSKTTVEVGNSANKDEEEQQTVNISELFPDAGWGWTTTTAAFEQPSDIVITTCVNDGVSSSRPPQRRRRPRARSMDDADDDALLDDTTTSNYDEDDHCSVDDANPGKPSSARAAAMFLLSSQTSNDTQD